MAAGAFDAGSRRGGSVAGRPHPANRPLRIFFQRRWTARPTPRRRCLCFRWVRRRKWRDRSCAVMYPDPGAARMNVSMQLTLLLAALLASPTLPSDPRLSTVRADLTQVVDQTYRAGLPADMLVAKIQEGLAK